ncbi:hypothetical protein HNQ61_005152 [Longimicrobium terrae]|uniref:Chromosome condensation regulator RCC1 n=1 Tax=Longimicrobium terrae TaxID=1639882 RepID=A0A841H6E4_9BACT|nr:hypothetical protein [Longimicrobium terrae]
MRRPSSPPRRLAIVPLLLALITLLFAGPARAQEVRWASVSVGDDHVCALDEQGRAWCFGNNHTAQLGLRTPERCGTVSESGRRDCYMTPSAAPLRAGGDTRFASVTAGRYLTCGVDAEGRGFCWGAAIGDADAYTDRCLNGTACSVRPQPLLPERRLTRVNLKARCAVDVDGAALCWGDGARAAGRMTEPWPGMASAQVDGDPEARTLCAVMRDGRAFCRGEAVFGVRGTGSADSAEAMRPVAAAERFAQVAAIGNWACGLDDAGAAHCWGAAGYGDVARDSVPRPGREQCVRWSVRTWCNLRPARVEGGQRFSGITAAVRGTLPTVYEMIGVTPGGAAYAWGGDRVLRPWHAEGRWRSAAAGDWGQCAISMDGDLFCWGSDPKGDVQGRIPHPEARAR